MYVSEGETAQEKNSTSLVLVEKREAGKGRNHFLICGYQWSLSHLI
jgi:hypothetical protein